MTCKHEPYAKRPVNMIISDEGLIIMYLCKKCWLVYGEPVKKKNVK
jgi:hypothetical protein